MRKLSLYLPIFFLVLLSCDPSESEDPVIKKPQPIGSKEISLIIDSGYDFNGYKAYTIIDSASLKNPDEKLYAPKGLNSSIFFKDPISGEIVAQINIDTLNSAYTVNKETVSRSLLSLVPNYSALSSEQKNQFGKDSNSAQLFSEFALIVDSILKNGDPIYSTNDEFINKLVELNELILEIYFKEYQYDARLLVGIDDFSSWLPDNGEVTISNLRESFVSAELTSLGNSDTYKKVLNPGEDFKLSAMGVKDNCYKVNINQSNLEAKQKNQVALATNVISMFFDQVFGVIKGEGRNDCIGTIAGSVITDVTTGVLDVSTFGISSVLTSIASIGKNAILTGATSGSCQKYALNSAIISKALLSQLNVFSKFVSVAKNAYSVIQMTPFVISLTPLSVNISEVMQLYDGKLIQACVEGTNASTFKEIYDAGSKIYPIVKMVPKSEYGQWNKAGFEVEWKATSPNGTVNLPSSSSNSNGEATVEWTLPTNFSGEVQLIAEIKDEEKDHLFGSPVSFKIKIAESQNSITDPRDGNVYKTVKIGTQTWFAENLRFAGNFSQVISPQAWAAIWNNGNPTGQAAWAYYNNDPGNNSVYGKLYNWYAVNSGTLCPQGWHIPNQAEWIILSNFLGGKEVSGGKMKAVTGWEEPNVGATNESGFMALPGGDRWYDGGFIHFGSNGSWWSSTTNIETGQVWVLELDNDVSDGILSQTYKPTGNSCRCLKD